MPAEGPLIGPIDAKSFTCWSHQPLACITSDDFAHAVTICDRSLEVRSGHFMRKVSARRRCDERDRGRVATGQAVGSGGRNTCHCRSPCRRGDHNRGFTEAEKWSRCLQSQRRRLLWRKGWWLRSWSDLRGPNACRDDPGRQPPGPDGGRWSIHHHRRGRWPIDSLGGRAPTTQTWSMSHRPPKSVDDVTSSTFAAGWGCREGDRCPIEHVRGGGVVRWPGPEEKSGGESCDCFLLLSAVESGCRVGGVGHGSGSIGDVGHTANGEKRSAAASCCYQAEAGWGGVSP